MRCHRRLSRPSSGICCIERCVDTMRICHIPRYSCFPHCLSMTAVGAAAENWPGWRGPRGKTEPASKHNAPVHWSATSNVVWKAEIAGNGPCLAHCLGRPRVHGERARGFRATVFCFASTENLAPISFGKKTVLTAPLEHKHQLNSHASSTPVTDGELGLCSLSL